MPVTAVYTLERAVVLNQFRIVSAIGRNDHYVTSISLEVTFIFSTVSQVKIMDDDLTRYQQLDIRR